MGVVISAIDGADGTKKSYTAYVYDEGAWKAMDGNYDAGNVYFGEDLTYTAGIGVLAAPTGSATLQAKGKSVKEVLASILAKEAYPSKTDPSVTISGESGYGTFEIGTVKNLAYTGNLSAGSYTYGPATGIEATSWSASCTGVTETKSTKSGTFQNVVAEATAKTVTVTATYGDGAIPVTNLGNPYAGVQASLGKADSALQASDAPGYNDILTKTEAGTTYVAQESGKRLMSNDEGTKLAGIEAQATKNSISLNGVANANPSFYAPISAGTAGQVLMSSGTGAPTWSEMPKSFIKFSQKNSALTPADGKAIWNIGASTHGIVSEDIMVQLFEVATGQQVFADVVVGADKSVRISMNASATVAANTYKAVLFG